MTATNWLQQTATVSVVVTVTEDPIPQVVLLTPSQFSVLSSQSFSLSASASSSCGSSQPLTYSWNVSDSSIQLNSGTVHTLNLYVNSGKHSRYKSILTQILGTLKPGNSYIFTFTATDTASSSASVNVVVQYDSLVAIIAGGNRVVGLEYLYVVLDGR